MKKKDPEKFQNIIAAAQELILQDGAGSVTTTKVAKKVGIAQSNIYIYFKNKDYMIAQVYSTAQERMRNSFDSIVGLDTRSAIKLYIDNMYRFAERDFATFEVLRQLKSMPNLAWLNKDNEDEELIAPISLIKRAQAENIMRPVAPSVIMGVTFGALHAHVLAVRAGEVTDNFQPVRELIYAAITRPV
ncbi:TetR/AcrR family transcriptional regulator [Lacticaseibacillus songhuajiangensis]|uniref:TetR/AcrR family transcriptional regulator n=1 Tax=Lacticaseibacillus songhuajiangensis TaxID=1296539 RepID=UPI000F776155|nr:TetR/AcrR family transcriptional regulator [Lacticaseibacillus songhuajiangensis]